MLGGGEVTAAKSKAQTAIQSGSAALQAGAYQSAVTEFTKALDTKKLNGKTAAITLLNRGLANQQLGKYVEAITDYERALQESKLNATTRAVALYNRGLANRKLYRTTLALEDFTNALILNPKFSQAYNSRANVLRELGYYTTAIADYDAAVRHKHPQMHIPLYGKALSHAAIRNLPAAKADLARALILKPNYKPARKLMARITTVPKQLNVNQPKTLVADNTTKRITTGSVDTPSTVIAKTNLPWAPAPKEVITATTAPSGTPAELFIKDNATAETVIANASINILSEQDVIAQPTAATPDKTAQNVVPAEKTEDPSLRAKIRPGETLVFVPGPGARTETAAQEIEIADVPATQVAALSPIELETATEPTVPADEFLIQLSAQTNETVARNLWNKMSDKHADVLGNLTPYIIKVQIDGKGTIYRVRAGGFGNRKAGSRLCDRLKRRSVSCYVTAANK